jgi:predicted nucleotidyltransferase
MHFDVDKYTIFKCMAGSHAYGLARPDSDVDLRGICIPPREIIISPFKNFEQHEASDPDDVVIWSILKFVKLAADCNPSILELFYISEKYWVTTSSWWERLREQRDIFLSTRAVHTFSGYAAAQLKRMRNHAKWMENTPAEPKPEDFGLSHAMLMGKDEIGAYDWLVEGEYVKFSKEIVKLMSRVKGYQQKLKEWKAYKQWRDKRNPDRAKLEMEHGFDTKHAYHIVRLARLGEELLQTGQMTVTDRPDKDELAAVREGLWSYEQILEFADAVDGRLKQLEERTHLPKKPDRDKIDQITQQIMEDYWHDR